MSLKTGQINKVRMTPLLRNRVKVYLKTTAVGTQGKNQQRKSTLYA